MFAKKQKHCIFAAASPTRPAPAESPRVGTQQGYVVERCDVGRLPIFKLTLTESFFVFTTKQSISESIPADNTF